MRRGLYSRGSEVSEEGFLGRVTRGGWGAGGGTRPWCHAGGSAKGHVSQERRELGRISVG